MTAGPFSLGSDGSDDRAPVRVDEAARIIAQAIVPVVGVERIPLDAAPGRVLAAPVIAPFDVPAHDNAAMDGFAVRASDLVVSGTQATLRVVGTARAGHPFSDPLQPGEALRITTGAWIPRGADAVLPHEHAVDHGRQVRAAAALARGAHLRRRGEDLRAGEDALPAGRCLRPTDLGWLASLGLHTVEVRRRPRVAVLSTGDELASPGEPLAPGRIYDSNRPALLALLRSAGVEICDLGTVRDSPAALASAMSAAAANADLVISSGGVSVGEADFTRSTLAELGSLAFRQVAMRPGRPLAFGRVGRALYVGLPGNPVAAVVAFEVLIRDAIERLAGVSSPRERAFQACTATAIPKQPGRSEFPRARVERGADGVILVRPLANQGTGTPQPLTEADCLILLSHDRGPIAAGERVECLPLQAA